ncbi:MAG: hypothetical protein KJ958_05520 [Gammaproteobacteria bacterium]|nr:hypothetical protein [Gammaproteobacteria bacterium]MBU1978613.1 hypothetical protein [Gammaproteobacteria bacterium]
MKKTNVAGDPLLNPLPQAGEEASAKVAALNDEPHGHGGSYVLDPDGDKRSLIERTQPAEHQSEKGA